MQKLSLGFSPCPNDTFIFDALVNGKIDTEGIEFDLFIEDVETLNQRALRNELDVSKLSFATFMNTVNHYQLLHSGSALGSGVGPLVVCNANFATENQHENLEKYFREKSADLSVAIPGKNTTANFLFGIFFPASKNKTEMVFSDIEEAVISGKATAGVIIHENRFTYEQKGLKKICDLGELWEKETGEPIPLGGIAVKRNLPDDLKEKINRILRRSVEYAFAHPSSSDEYVKKYAQEMDEEVRKKHIALYVNPYSVDLGEKGRHAIETLFSKAKDAGLISSVENSVFINHVPHFSNE